MKKKQLRAHLVAFYVYLTREGFMIKKERGPDGAGIEHIADLIEGYTASFEEDKRKGQ